MNYRLLEDRLHCDAEQVTLTYIFRPHESSFPAFFAAALVARLSAEFCIPLTESSARAQILFNQAEAELRAARRGQPAGDDAGDRRLPADPREGLTPWPPPARPNRASPPANWRPSCSAAPICAPMPMARAACAMSSSSRPAASPAGRACGTWPCCPGLARLVAFEFNTEQTYLLVFTHGLFSVYLNDAMVAQGGAPWSHAQLPQLAFTQSADTLLICHPDTRRASSPAAAIRAGA